LQYSNLPQYINYHEEDLLVNIFWIGGDWGGGALRELLAEQQPIHTTCCSAQVLINVCSVADPDPGSDAFLISGCGTEVFWITDHKPIFLRA
jgi:hypothetical protein